MKPLAIAPAPVQNSAMRLLSLMVALSSLVSAQEAPQLKALNFGSDTTFIDTVDGRSNAYIQEDWAYFAERLRNEFLALGERKYQRRDFQGAVLEYYSFILHFPDDGLIPLVRYRMGRAYHRIGELALARDQYFLSRDHAAADPRVRMVSVRQLARLDYDAGRHADVLALPINTDPYILVLKGFSSLTVEEWRDAQDYFVSARRYYPSRGQAVLDRIIADVEQLNQIRYYSAWGNRIWNIAPGGGLARIGSVGDAMGFGVGVGTLALGAILIDNWTRWVMAAGAGGLYWASYGAAGRQRDRANESRLQKRLDAIISTYNINVLWSFGHPAIF
ncbi:MAG: hypothetical protein IIA59_07870 [Candidatus Marinimicrobia bacterium]|nr:hypothetical protein [Candidatus Neomarinimicrobiota bacterium]